MKEKVSEQLGEDFAGDINDYVTEEDLEQMEDYLETSSGRLQPYYNKVAK